MDFLASLTKTKSGNQDVIILTYYYKKVVRATSVATLAIKTFAIVYFDNCVFQ